MISAQMNKVIALQQLVRKLGEADARLALHAGAHLQQWGRIGDQQRYPSKPPHSMVKATNVNECKWRPGKLSANFYQFAR